MGYDIHIIRSDDWSSIDAGQDITADEWLDYVSADPELTLAGYNGKYFALWSGHSGREDRWFDWTDGRVHTKNPDASVVAKAIGIARALGARVQGDDREFYLPDGRIEIDGVIISGPNATWRQTP
jgi:hypothetical protein